ncbi:hypothetical protein [Marinovum sp.]|uniref:hypothetical protein n=1 Tax=Marinovum sp. TaxID=2024839 RepID=UPI003A8D2167
MRKFTHSLLAAAMALTSLVAAPAAAEHQRFQFGFSIGNGTIQLFNPANPFGRHAYHKDRGYDRGKGKGYARRVPLPAYCLRRIETHRGPVRMFGSRCLQRNYRQADWLPRACLMEVRTWRHGRPVTRVGYHPRCLRDRGYRVANYR